MALDDNGDDLYGDLDTSVNALARKEFREREAAFTKECDRLRKELAVLQHENKRLGERNHVLEVNMSKLFVTAQTEIKRKDREIQRLREEVERTDKAGSAGSATSYPPRDHRTRDSAAGRHDSRHDQHRRS